jgi:subtilase family serine protease
VALGVAALTVLGSVTAQAAPTATPGTLAGPNSVASLRAEVQHGTLLQTHGVMNACATTVKLACLAEVVTTSPGSKKALSSTTPAGYGATDLEKAYGLTGDSGQSGTIAIIDAGAYPTLESDLDVYRAQYGLPACTSASGCLKIADYKGGPPLQPSTSGEDPIIEEEVAVETSLDVDMASAACPNCKIIELQLPDEDALIEGSNADPETTDFGTAVNTAAALGANSVSMSYQYPTDQFEETGTPGLDLFHPGMAVLASSGDGGYEGNTSTGWPSNLPWVTSVGGTSLYENQNGTFTSTAWAGAGSGCETSLPAAIGQPAAISKNCGGHRTGSDISAVADPNTGVAQYDTYAPYSGEPYDWIFDGGTSVSSPFVAGIYARAGNLSQVIGPNTLYTDPASDFTDVTIGSNTPPNTGVGPAPLYTAGKGWDGPSGLGTPKGLAGF